jgi:hypothetical protein
LLFNQKKEIQLKAKFGKTRNFRYAGGNMKKIFTFGIIFLVGFFLLTDKSQALTITGTSGSQSAEAIFEMPNAGSLTITLTNTSTADVLIPTELLTAIFFSGIPALTPVSATLNSGSTVSFGPDGGGNVGGEWAFATGLVGAPNGATGGISSAGFGLFGNPNFVGSNLQDPAAVDGDNYGITSANDNLATGNAQVTGNVALIKNSVIFGLSGLPGGFDLSSITNVSFQYGTVLTDPNVPGTPPQVPEPGTLLLLGAGLLGLVVVRRRK